MRVEINYFSLYKVLGNLPEVCLNKNWKYVNSKVLFSELLYAIYRNVEWNRSSDLLDCGCPKPENVIQTIYYSH